MARASASAARLIELFARRVHSENLIVDLMPGQWAVLRFLARGASDRSVVEVANYIGVDVVESHRAIVSLQRKRLVEITPARNGSHERVRLVEAGRKKLLRDPVLKMEVALAALTAEEEQQLYELLDRVITRLGP